ncbi:MAG TPA: nucleotide exchange factor GrpE [Abditibacteriaceae bacterium]
MAEQNQKPSEKESASSGLRFRLPKLFADAGDDDVPSAEKVAQKAEALGITLPSVASSDVIAAANRDYAEPRASVLQVPLDQTRADHTRNLNDAGALLASSSHVEEDEEPIAPTTRAPRPQESTTEFSAPGANDAWLKEVTELRSGIEDMQLMLMEMNERGTAQDKVFNTLHNELQDYKNDFIYEHLKPVVRPLLFLYDSIEQFDGELYYIEEAVQAERRQTLSPKVVRENVNFFREQLVEALRICEVTPMATPTGVVDPRLHKVIDTVTVDVEQDNMIQRVVRSGWYLNGRVFRPAEVVIGKKQTNNNAQVWNHGNKQ